MNAVHGGASRQSAANAPVPVDDAGNIDWTRVTRVQIEFIGDYHD